MQNFGVTNKEHYGMLWSFSGVVNDYNILRDPGAVNRVGRKGATKGTQDKPFADWAQ